MPWVTAFGVAGPLVGRLSPHGRRLAGPLGALLLAISYVGIAISLLAGTIDGALLVTLLGAGGLGLGIEFTAMVGHLTNLASSDDAADMSGLLNTTFCIAGVMGVAVFGTITHPLFDKFTGRARKVLSLDREEAQYSNTTPLALSICCWG